MPKLVSKSPDYKWHMDISVLTWLYYEKELSMKDIGSLLGVSWATVQQQMNKHGLKRRSRYEPTDRSREKLSKSREDIIPWNSGLAGNYEKWTKYGKDAARYNGGRKVTDGGYIKILNHDHPHKDVSGYVLEHRLVYEKFLGRYLTPEEIIHHKDGDKANNNIENLFLFPNNGLHSSFHMYKAHVDPCITEEKFMEERGMRI